MTSGDHDDLTDERPAVALTHETDAWCLAAYDRRIAYGWGHHVVLWRPGAASPFEIVPDPRSQS